MPDTPSFFMQQAITQAKQCLVYDEVPVGAVIVDKSGHIIAEAGNRVITGKDPSAHAEILAIRAACETIDNERLLECDLYVTLEPCPMCAAAISMARIRRLYFGAYDPKSGGVEHGPRIFNTSSCHHQPDVYGGILENSCAEILKTFFQDKR